jgi:ABC-type nitrate/sulfonate/bicarbonate transport system ATPase subunit
MHALKILSVENAVTKFPSELSGGMKKRVSIAGRSSWSRSSCSTTSRRASSTRS